MREGNGEQARLRDTAGALRMAMREFQGALNRPEDDPALEDARRALVRRWAELATAVGSQPHWVLAMLVRAMDRMDAEDAQRERGKRRKLHTTQESYMRHVPYPELDIREVRAFIALQVERSSLRIVADRIGGTNHTTLAGFLNKDGMPHAKTRRVLCEYYIRENHAEPEVTVALEILAGYFPPARRAARGGQRRPAGHDGPRLRRRRVARAGMARGDAHGR